MVQTVVSEYEYEQQGLASTIDKSNKSFVFLIHCCHYYHRDQLIVNHGDHVWRSGVAWPGNISSPIHHPSLSSVPTIPQNDNDEDEEDVDYEDCGDFEGDSLELWSFELLPKNQNLFLMKKGCLVKGTYIISAKLIFGQ